MPKSTKSNPARNSTRLPSRDQMLSKAYGDLEYRISDLKGMAAVTEAVLEDIFEEQTEDEKWPGYETFHLTDGQVKSLAYATMHLRDLINDFYDDYYEKLESK